MLLKIAGLTLTYDSDYPSLMERMFSDYLCDDVEGVALKLDPKPWLGTITDETGQGPEAVEFYAVSAALGEQLPKFGRLQTHGVAIEFGGKAYIFSAPSGVGKSTRAFLWQKYLGEDKVTIINGDKPILWFSDGQVLACGSPWAGKEGLQKTRCVPLGGICLLQRSADNTIRRATPQEFFDTYTSQVQMPREGEAMMSALSLVEELYAKVPTFVLANDISEQGVKVAFEALTGNVYENHRI